MAEFDDDRVRALADLAHLSLQKGERESFAAELASIVEYAERIQSLDTEGVPPASHALLRAGGSREEPLRDDEPTPSLERDRVLEGAPQTGEGLFRVPKVLP